jgi:hypothetical protein
VVSCPGAKGRPANPTLASPLTPPGSSWFLLIWLLLVHPSSFAEALLRCGMKGAPTRLAPMTTAKAAALPDNQISATVNDRCKLYDTQHHRETSASARCAAVEASTHEEIANPEPAEGVELRSCWQGLAGFPALSRRC